MELPTGYEIEKQVICAYLANSKLYLETAKELTSECFNHPQFLEIYQTINKLYQERGYYDIHALIDFFEQNDLWDTVGDRGEIVSLFSQQTNTSAKLHEHISLLRDYAFKRALAKTGVEITSLALDPTKDIATIALESKTKLEDCYSLKSKAETKLVESLVDNIKAYVSSGDSKGVSTGFKLLDRLLGGFKPAKLYIIAGRTGMGKTNIGVFFALQLAQKNKFPVIFFSAEMQMEALGIRFIANLCQVNSSSIANNYMSFEEQDRFKEGLTKFSKLNLIIDGTQASELDANRISSVIQSAILKFGGVSAVFIDYIQLLGNYNVARRDLAIGEISRSCKDFGKTFNLPFICLAQIKRDVASRADKRPTLSDLKDSGQLEQDCDAIMALYRDEYYNEFSDQAGITELNLIKNRDGPLGGIKLDHDLATCSYIEPKTFTLNLG